MYSQAATITQRATNKGPLNILCMDTHERYQSNLAKTGHNFYSFYIEKEKKWDENYAQIPDNYYRVMNPSESVHLHSGIYFDLVLSQSKFGQFQVLAPIAREIGAPLVSVEHTLPHSVWSPQKFNLIKSMQGDYNIFLSDFSRKSWEYDGNIIHNSVDTGLFSPADKERKPYALSIVNEWKTRDYFCGYNLWKEVTQDIPTRVRGDNEGWTTPTKTTEELINEYRSATVFLNTSLNSTCPTTVLEAAACGIPIVTTATTMLPEIISNGYNGYISNEPGELNRYVKYLLERPDIARWMGANARQTMIEKFSMDSFISKWNELFESTREFVFKG